MRIATFEGKGKIRIKEAAKPTIQNDEDVIIKVIRTCVCGSDLWAYRGLQAHDEHLIRGTWNC